MDADSGRNEFGIAAQRHLLAQERALVERYVHGYTEHPETAEDLVLSDKSIAEVFAENPWDEAESGTTGGE